MYYNNDNKEHEFTEQILTVQHSTCNRRISEIIREALGVIPLAEQGHVMQRTAMGKCKLGQKQNSNFFFLNLSLFCLKYT